MSIISEPQALLLEGLCGSHLGTNDPLTLNSACGRCGSRKVAVMFEHRSVQRHINA